MNASDAEDNPGLRQASQLAQELPMDEGEFGNDNNSNNNKTNATADDPCQERIPITTTAVTPAVAAAVEDAVVSTVEDPLAQERTNNNHDSSVQQQQQQQEEESAAAAGSQTDTNLKVDPDEDLQLMAAFTEALPEAENTEGDTQDSAPPTQQPPSDAVEEVPPLLPPLTLDDFAQLVQDSYFTNNNNNNNTDLPGAPAEVMDAFSVAVAQMRPCGLTKDDRVGKYRQREEGFVGMCCQHCGGQPGM